MKKINVLEMHCNNCINRISKALAEEGITFEISLEEKTVSCAEADVDKVNEILDDLGF